MNSNQNKEKKQSASKSIERLSNKHFYLFSLLPIYLCYWIGILFPQVVSM